MIDLDRQPPPLVAVVAFAAWAGIILLLALGGRLGGRVGPHPADPARMPSLPAFPAPQTLADAYQMSDREVAADGVASADAKADENAPTDDPVMRIAARPLFAPDRRPSRVATAASPDERPFNGSLTSVLIAGEVRIAIFSGVGDREAVRVRLGDPLPGTSWRLVDLQPREASIEGPEGRRTLVLRVFDGQGGASPTPKAADPVAPAPADSPAQPVAEAGGVTSPSADEQAQIEAIRQRIAARRAQLQQSQQDAPAEPANPEER